MKKRNEEAQEEIFNFNKPDYKFEPNEVHAWRQQGPYVVCKSCELTHATYVGMGKIMTGINKKGQPILSKRSVTEQ